MNGNIVNYPDRNDLTEKRKRCIGTWLRLFAETKIRRASDELTEEKCRAFEWELRDIPLEHLDSAFARAARTLRFFPVPVEIRDFCADPEAHARAYEKLRD